jgi:hypothetical protein
MERSSKVSGVNDLVLAHLTYSRLGAYLLLLRRYGIKLINGRPRAPNVQGLVEQSNSVVEDKIAKWIRDNGSPFWHLALTEVANQMNAQFHTAIKKSPFEVVFRQKTPINWLTTQERFNTEGVSTEDGQLITEESLSKELEGEEDEEVLARFQELSEYLNIQVPEPKGTTREKEPVTRISRQPNLPVSPPKVLLPTPRASRVVPLPVALVMSKS